MMELHPWLAVGIPGINVGCMHIGAGRKFQRQAQAVWPAGSVRTHVRVSARGMTVSLFVRSRPICICSILQSHGIYGMRRDSITWSQAHRRGCGGLSGYELLRQAICHEASHCSVDAAPLRFVGVSSVMRSTRHGFRVLTTSLFVASCGGLAVYTIGLQIFALLLHYV